MYNCERLINILEGLQTIDSIMEKLAVKRATAIKYVHLLRKGGFVDTKVGREKIHLYKVSRNPNIKIGNPGYLEILNKYSPIKIQEPYEHRVIGKEISIEETIAWAATQKDIRIHIAVLALFKYVKSWPRLYKWAKLFNTRRRAGSLYDVSRRIFKVRRIDLRIRKNMETSKKEPKYLIKHLQSKDYKDIEKKWNIFIPFNKKDLERYNK